MDEAPEAAEVEVVEVEVIEEEALADGQLYVVEERIIRARPARILSDGTVEAETDDAKATDLATLLLEQAEISAGAPLPDPAAFVQRMNRVLLGG